MWLSFCKPDACSVEQALVPGDDNMEIEKAFGQLSSITHFRQSKGAIRTFSAKTVPSHW